MSAETQLEVFGTKEVSVKEFMGSSDKSLVLLSDYEKAKQNLEDLKAKHQARVEELVSVEKLSAEELKELNGIRAELREPRYLIQNIEKDNISVFEAYKKKDKANLRALIEINVSLEDKATEKLQSEDKRKKEEKELAEKAEENRINKIKSDIDNIETYCYQVIQKMTFENLKTSTEAVEQSLNGDYDFEEFDLLLDQVKDRIVKQLLEKTNDLTAIENQRLENEKMKEEIFEVRVNRLKELGFELEDSFFVFEQSELKLGRLAVLNMTSVDFEKQLSDIKLAKEQAEQHKRDAELKQQKDEQFEVRKSRLIEIGLDFQSGAFLYERKILDSIYVYNASVIEFEQILVDAKKSIQEAKEQKEIADKRDRLDQRVQIIRDLGFEVTADETLIFHKEFESICFGLDELESINEEGLDELIGNCKNRIKDFEKEAQKKAEAENKARVKRLANDKEWLRQNIELTLVSIHDVSIKNQEAKDFMSFANLQIEQLKADLLNQLKEL